MKVEPRKLYISSRGEHGIAFVTTQNDTFVGCLDITPGTDFLEAYLGTKDFHPWKMDRGDARQLAAILLHFAETGELKVGDE